MTSLRRQPIVRAPYGAIAATQPAGTRLTDRDGLQRSPEAPWQSSSRYADQPMSWTTRLFGIGGVLAIGLLILAGLDLTWRSYSPASSSPSLSVFDVPPAASPPETPPAEKEAPKPLERERPPVTRAAPPTVRTIVPIAPETVPMPVATPETMEPAPVELEAASPKTQPAPPAPKVSGKTAETWEGRVLARLNQHRRYPRAAMARRQQGVPYIRFVMDREGRVLSATLERSSGVPELDREAVALPRRAQPLPKPPADMRPGQATIELVVPVEFFLLR